MSPFDPDDIARASASPRWSALVRTDVDPEAIGRWDPALDRQTRVLVPVDVQALFVPAGSAEPMVRVPLSLSAPDGEKPAPPTPVLDPGKPRPAGVHLHWAPPDALLRGSLGENSGANRLQLPPLPDRWVVLRILVPLRAAAPHVRGWVIEADTAKAIPLESWPAGAAAVPQAGRTVAPDELTGSAGGSLNWVGVYDAAINRLAFFDPLEDLKSVTPDGVEGSQAAYLVAGWWSTPSRDPLDGVQTRTSLGQRLTELRWALETDAEGGDTLQIEREVRRQKQATLGLNTAGRYEQGTPVSSQRRATVPPATIAKQAFRPVTSIFADELTSVVQQEPSWPRSTLLHGCVYGVPIEKTDIVENRPDVRRVEVAFGEAGDDLAAALTSASLASRDAADRRAVERLLAAFTGHVLDRIGTADGLVDVEEHEHAGAFVALPGGAGATERLLTGRQAASLAAGRKARAEQARRDAAPGPGTRISLFATSKSDLKKVTVDEQRGEAHRRAGGTAPEKAPAVETRDVVRPAPRLHLPADPMIAIRGARRSLRHGGDGRFSPDKLLHCRWPSQVIRGIDQVIEGREILPSLQSGAIPEEVVLLAREVMLVNPYLAPWLARTAAGRRSLDTNATTRRLVAEAALRFGVDAIYDGRTAAFQPATRAPGTPQVRVTDHLVADQLHRFSLVLGTDPDPVGVTVWSQPWVPLWLDWEVELTSSDRLLGWRLAAVDYESVEDAAPDHSTRRFRGRSPLTTGTAATLAAAVRGWLAAEDQRDRDNAGEADEATEAALSRIADAIENLDVLAVTLDGIREQLLGLKYEDGLVRPRKEDGSLGPPEPTGQPPVFLRGGTIQLTRARIVDAFGRTLPLPVEATRVPVRSEVADMPAGLRLRPRLTLPARLLFRFIDPAAAGSEADEARVDQVNADGMINPVAAFLLPDHIDEALEVFDSTGAPLGQIMHEPIGGGVMWEIAPGREGPPDAAPLHGLTGAARHAGFFAAGIVTADARARGGTAADPDRDSALTALLRAIDTTLWTVDTFRSLGSEHIAGLVGRPIAVVRARLSLDIASDFGLDGAAAAAALADRAFTVRVGELTRGDDGLLAYFVNDDYEHVHIVDKVVASMAFESRRQRGHLGQYGTAPRVPPRREIDHRYVVAEDELVIRPNQTLILTLLMHPAGKVHLTSGVVPRKSLQLARDWVAPGLAVIAPSARVGPVLIDPATVRLPKISAFPKDQMFTRRDTPSTWKNDPILSATQAALLPDLPHEVQEGYIRIAPETTEGDA
jgi:hypothetical protein